MAQSQENLWFCGDGIYRATPDSLQRWERERDTPPDYTRFNRADGMSSMECSGGFRNMAVTNDGGLWVATEQGIAMLEFSRLRHTDRKPTIFIERIVTGKTTQPPGRELVLPAGTNHVELHFDTIELASPEAIRMQYRLDDVDREWLDADSTVTAVYSGIPVGTHQFHVRACNSDGVWDRAGIFYNVTQKPYFYESNLFRLGVVTIFTLLLAGAYRLRLRRITALMNARLDERLAERTRMARELHDTLLQSFHGLMFRFQAARNMLPRRPEDAMQALDTALERTEQAIAEGRDTIHGLRASTEVTNELMQAVAALGKEMRHEMAPQNSTQDSTQGSTNDSARFHVVVEGPPRDLHPILRDEIYAIAREAVRNAFRHAQARNIEADITYHGSSFQLRIRDDGTGIDPEIMAEGRAGHYGLPGMRERAKRIGGKLGVWTGTGAGTEIELSLPGSIAYGTSPGRTVFGLFRKKTANS
jgi:signal transduction histidine kinase